MHKKLNLKADMHFQ